MYSQTICVHTGKNNPGWCPWGKYATRMGGAQNQRRGLWDAAMIKENHVLVAGGVCPAVARAKAAGVARIICEVDNLEQIEPAIAAGAKHVLLDNMGPDTLRRAAAIVTGRLPTEGSGGVNLQTLGALPAPGVTRLADG